jgi:hypothetical protein
LTYFHFVCDIAKQEGEGVMWRGLWVMTGAGMGEAVACEYAFDGSQGGYGADGVADELLLNGPWAAWEWVVVEGEPDRFDDLLDLGRAEGF